jgi:hypothetical protein
MFEIRVLWCITWWYRARRVGPDSDPDPGSKNVGFDGL